ncbi:MAG TPA: hypothetical protein DCG28_02405 [Lachnospiraceae bacterium]|nr:hypothetical protein [Lachnospiraceae bacterium]
MPEKIKEAVEKIIKDESLRNEFLKDPTSTVEKLIGVDLPNDQIDAVIKQIKDAISQKGVDSIIDKIKNTVGIK